MKIASNRTSPKSERLELAEGNGSFDIEVWRPQLSVGYVILGSARNTTPSRPFLAYMEAPPYFMKTSLGLVALSG